MSVSLQQHGLVRVLMVLRGMEPLKRLRMLKELERRGSGHLVALYRRFEFSYQDIFLLDSKSTQSLLRSHHEDMWLLAFKLTSAPLREWLLENMSDSTRQNFIQRFKTQPKAPRIQVIKTQINLAKAAHSGVMAGELFYR